MAANPGSSWIFSIAVTNRTRENRDFVLQASNTDLCTLSTMSNCLCSRTFQTSRSHSQANSQWHPFASRRRRQEENTRGWLPTRRTLDLGSFHSLDPQHRRSSQLVAPLLFRCLSSLVL